MGDNYDAWMNGFFTRNQPEFSVYQDTARLFEESVENGLVMADIHQKSLKLAEKINQMKKRVLLEKPAWRFQWGLVFIQTIGWPFNQKAEVFAQKLLQEFSFIESQLGSAINWARERIDQSAQTVAEEKVSPVFAVKAVSYPDSKNVFERARDVIAESQKETKSISPKPHAVVGLDFSTSKFDIFHESIIGHVRAFQKSKNGFGFQPFKSMQNLLIAMNILLEHRSLSPDNEKEFFYSYCDDLLGRLPNKTDKKLNSNGRYQVELTIKLLNLAMLDEVQMKDKELFIEEAEAIFAKMNRHSTTFSACSTHGLMRASEHKPHKVKDSHQPSVYRTV